MFNREILQKVGYLGEDLGSDKWINKIDVRRPSTESLII
jgi:hypothetical protein